MNHAAYTALCQRHMASFYRIALSIVGNQHDAEDALQQTLLKAWQFREKARPGSERAWMMRILINESMNIFRQRKKAIPTEEFPCSDADFFEDDLLLREAIRALPTALRTPLLLRYMEGMSEKEIASALQIPVSRVKSRLFRARQALKKELNEEVEP